MCTFNENSIYYHLKVCSDNGRNNSDEIGISGLAAIVVSSLMSQILCWQFSMGPGNAWNELNSF